MNKLQQHFDQIVSELFNVQILLEHCHRQTKSEPRHESLGDAYEDFAELKDRIIEEMIGGLSINYTQLAFKKITGYSPALCDIAADNTVLLGKVIALFGEKYDQGNLSNLGEELESVGNKLKFKLSLNDSDEILK